MGIICKACRACADGCLKLMCLGCCNCHMGDQDSAELLPLAKETNEEESPPADVKSDARAKDATKSREATRCGKTKHKSWSERTSQTESSQVTRKKHRQRDPAVASWQKATQYRPQTR